MKRPEPGARWLLAGVLALSLGLNLVPLWWGMPNYDGWAFDEIRPGLVERGLERWFSNDWATAYPPLHYYLLSLLYAPLRLAEGRGMVALAPIEATTWRYLLGRALSVLLATATVYFVYRTSRLVCDRFTAALAALAVALMAPFVYYAKTMNLEAPYFFWFVLSVFFFLRALRQHRLRDYLAFAVAATCSICTKDQAYGFHALPAVALVVSLHRWRRSREGAPAGWWRAAIDRRPLLAGSLAAVLFALIHNLAFNWEGFERHVRIITERSPSLFDLYPPTAAGQLAMGAQSVRHLAFALGLPLFLAALAGLGWTLRHWRREARWLALFLPAVSYYLSFIAVVRHNYVRFLLPICILLAPFAARALVAAWRWRRFPRPAAAVLLVLVFGFSFLRALTVDLRMFGDGRYRTEAWLRENASDGTVIAVGRQNMLPRGVRVVRWGPIHRRGLGRWDADYVVVSVDDLWDEQDRAFYDGLRNGEAGYAEVFRYRYRPPIDLLDTRGMFTNLDKINPEVVVFRRRPSGA